jgi:CTP synthase
MTKYIAVVGGVISGVGKGVATASIGRIMKEYGFSVTAIKIDPYINCDAGTMRPTEHGEVWVTEDGGEIDQDLGTYERFLSENIPKKNNITTGQIYKSLIEKERRGDFLGKTVEVIPHVPEEIKSRIIEAGKEKDIALVELGGTVGDYQNIPFLFALKSLENDIGKENITYILVSYLPIPSHIEEMKTKPTQMAISLLRESGIQPDFVLCRGKKSLDEVRKKKIERYANIKSDRIISMPDVTGEKTLNTVYVVPLDLEQEKLGEKILKELRLEKKQEPNWEEWNNVLQGIVNPTKTIKVAMVGKYLGIGDFELKDSYISISEALKHAGARNKTKVDIDWIDSNELESGDLYKISQVDGIIVPGGFGESGVEGKINAIKYARENKIPYLGLCYGLQLAVIEFARSVCKLKAGTTEINPQVQDPVIDIMPEQKLIKDKGATMRLGAYKAVLKERTKIREIYGKEEIEERHRHRYEVNPNYHKVLEENGLVLSGMSPDKRLVEFIELPGQFFIGTQAHPEFKSRFLSPSPIFDAFVKACVQE